MINPITAPVERFCGDYLRPLRGNLPPATCSEVRIDKDQNRDDHGNWICVYFLDNWLTFPHLISFHEIFIGLTAACRPRRVVAGGKLWRGGEENPNQPSHHHSNTLESITAADWWFLCALLQFGISSSSKEQQQQATAMVGNGLFYCAKMRLQGGDGGGSSTGWSWGDEWAETHILHIPPFNVKRIHRKERGSERRCWQILIFYYCKFSTNWGCGRKVAFSFIDGFPP